MFVFFNFFLYFLKINFNYRKKYKNRKPLLKNFKLKLIIYLSSSLNFSFNLLNSTKSEGFNKRAEFLNFLKS